MAYYFLLICSKAITADDLDSKIEAWFAAKFEIQIDFEIDDALKKLLRFALITNNNELYTVTTLENAQLGWRDKWSDLFE